MRGLSSPTPTPPRITTPAGRCLGAQGASSTQTRTLLPLLSTPSKPLLSTPSKAAVPILLTAHERRLFGRTWQVCNSALSNTQYSAFTSGTPCDWVVGSGGFADSNGDDVMALVMGPSPSSNPTSGWHTSGQYTIMDIYGVIGQDGTNRPQEVRQLPKQRSCAH
jgi:hypothetical protein